MDLLVNFFCTLFLFVCSIKCTAGGAAARRRGILCCRQIKKVCRKSEQGSGRPPAVHFMLQTTRKSVQKKLTSKIINGCIVSLATGGNERVKPRWEEA